MLESTQPMVVAQIRSSLSMTGFFTQGPEPHFLAMRKTLLIVDTDARFYQKGRLFSSEHFFGGSGQWKL